VLTVPEGASSIRGPSTEVEVATPPESGSGGLAVTTGISNGSKTEILRAWPRASSGSSVGRHARPTGVAGMAARTGPIVMTYLKELFGQVISSLLRNKLRSFLTMAGSLGASPRWC